MRPDIVSSPFEIVLAFLIFGLGFVVCIFSGKRFDISSSRTSVIYIWHTLFCLVYCWYVLSDGGDAIAYYLRASEGYEKFSLGTRAVVSVASVLINGLGLSFLGVFLFFNVIGAVGLLAFDGSLRSVVRGKSVFVRSLATLIVFLPSISFWSSALGKDAISFLSMGLALWSALDMRKRWWLMILSIGLMLIVRPHMAGMMGLGLAGSFVFQRGVPLPQRLMFGAMAIMAALLLVPLGLNYAGVGDSAGATEVIEFIEQRQGYNQKGGGAVDITTMSPPVQMFTYLFRPTLIEARNLFSLAAALDNTILFFLFIAGCWAMLKKPLPAHLLAHNRMFLWLYSLCAWLILAMTTANLGIALRQKWMFAPMLIFLLISLVGKNPGLSGRNDLVVR